MKLPTVAEKMQLLVMGAIIFGVGAYLASIQDCYLWGRVCIPRYMTFSYIIKVVGGLTFIVGAFRLWRTK